MSTVPNSIAERIFNARDETSILKFLLEYPTSSQKLLERYHEHSALVWALARAYDAVAIEIIRRQTKEDLLQSFKYNKEKSEVQQQAGEMLLRILDLNFDKFPTEIKGLVKDLQNRKMLALFVGITGHSNFYGIPWVVEGHHNYKYISEVLFQMLVDNQKEIMGNAQMVMNNSLPLSADNQEKVIKSLSETFVLMNKLQSLSLQNERILPVLVGTKSGTHLHAEGFVWYDPKYLAVERSNRNQPGVIIYEIDDKFDKKSFFEFIKKAQKSSEADDETALNFEDYTSHTTASGHLKEVGYIKMTLQDPKNCPTASSEGIFLATLYCKLLEHGIEVKLAQEYALQYSNFTFKINKEILYENMKKQAAQHETDDLNKFLEEIENWNNRRVQSPKKTVATPIKVLNAEINKDVNEREILTFKYLGKDDRTSSPEPLTAQTHKDVERDKRDEKSNARNTQAQPQTGGAQYFQEVEIPPSEAAPLVAKTGLKQKSKFSNICSACGSWFWNKLCKSKKANSKKNQNNDDDSKLSPPRKF